jgi:hypothetical protein
MILTPLDRLSEYATSITKEEIKSALKQAPNPEGSTINLIAAQDFASVITDPREYQIELFERAKKQNTIAVLDTGIILHTPQQSGSLTLMQDLVRR